MIGEWLQGAWGWLVAGLLLACVVGLAGCVLGLVVLRRQLRAVVERVEAVSWSLVDAPLVEPPVVGPGAVEPSLVEPALVEPVEAAPRARAATGATGGHRSFSDTLLRESVVKGAAFVYGVRHALRPEARNRMRFEMRQEIKRARRQRRQDLKQARRDLRGRQRAGMAEEDAA